MSDFRPPDHFLEPHEKFAILLDKILEVLNFLQEMIFTRLLFFLFFLFGGLVGLFEKRLMGFMADGHPSTL